MSLRPRVHSSAFKLHVCEQIAAGQVSQAQACREHNLAHSLIERWYRAYKDHGNLAFVRPAHDARELMERRVADLERLCGQLTLENELLKRALKASQSTNAMR
jgi:transposase